MQYLSYDRYKELNPQGELKESGFILAERVARARIDRSTFNRITAEYDGSQEYKSDLELLMLFLIQNPVVRDEVIVSEAVDGVSVAYKNAEEQELSIRADEAVTSFLCGYKDKSGTPLLYRGGNY